MTKREELLASIKPGMKLDRAFFLKVYGFTITEPGFSDIVIKILNDAGCSRAEEYYHTTVEEYEKQWREQIKPVAKWLSENNKKEYERKEGEELRKRRTQDLLQKSDIELLRLLQSMNSSS